MSYANLNSVPSVVAGVTPVEASQWNTYVRDNFDALKGGHLILTSSEKNALTGIPAGLMVYDSDLGVLQMWNGSVWVLVGAETPLVSSFIPSGTAAGTYTFIPLSSSFFHFRLRFHMLDGPSGTGGANLKNWRLRVANGVTVDTASDWYYTTGIAVGSLTNGSELAVCDSGAFPGALSTGDSKMRAEYDFININRAAIGVFNGYSFVDGSGYLRQGYHNSKTIFDSLAVYWGASATLSGDVYYTLYAIR